MRSQVWRRVTAANHWPIPDKRPSGEPWAELWLGAHPAAPATVGSRAEPLDRAIAAVGPAVLLCTDGCVEANGVILDRGTAAWSGAGEPEVALVGKGTLFCASVPREG